MIRRCRAWLLALGLITAAAHAHAEGAADLFAGFQAKSSEPVQIDAQTLEVFEQGKERISVFTGDVVVTRGETILRAASIRLHQDLQGRSDAFTRIEADGGISVKSNAQSLTGRSAVVDMVANTIVVSGGVVLSQGANILTGTRLVVDLASGRARIEGGTVRGVFTPNAP